MTVTATTLFESTGLTTSAATIYTSSNVKTIIDKFTATNYTSSTTPAAVSFTVYLVASGGTAGDSTNSVVLTKTLQAGETYTLPEVVGHILNSGDFISVKASANSSINVRASGRLVT